MSLKTPPKKKNVSVRHLGGSLKEYSHNNDDVIIVILHLLDQNIKMDLNLCSSCSCIKA